MTAPSKEKPAPDAIAVSSLQESELEAADQIFRLAFGTFIGLPDPTKFAAGCDYVRRRGFRSFTQGVAMNRNFETIYNRIEAFVIDDWR